MKKFLIYIGITIFLFVMPNQSVVKAKNRCENRTLTDYRELLKNIKIYSDYRIVDNQAVFDVTITNIPYDVYIEDTKNEKIYKYEDFTTQNELIIRNYAENQKLNYRFYTSASGCYGQVLGSRTVTLPNYNENTVDSLCAGIQEFSLCRKWGGTTVNREELEKKTNEYREKSNLIPKPNEKKTQNEKMKNKIVDFIGKYYIYMVAAVAIVVLLLIALKTKAEEKSEFDFKV